MRVPKPIIFLVVFFLASLVGYSVYNSKSGLFLTNMSATPYPSPAFAPIPAMPSLPFNGIQMIKSLLGLQVQFQNGRVNYAGLSIIKDPRYQALSSHEKLVDAIRFQPFQAPAYFILIAIAKSLNGTPAIVPGKFDIVGKTEKEGFILRDAHGRLFYYSGYVLATPAWQNLIPGQSIEDKFCKQPIPTGLCSPKNSVKVLLNKAADARKDIPFLALIP